jgi:hypothetical protein
VDEDDAHEEIAQLEARIEELADVVESCRKVILASKAAIAAGALLILAVVIGVIRFDPLSMIGALAAVLGGIVLFGSNASTSKQATAALRAAEARRVELIDAMELRPVGDDIR